MEQNLQKPKLLPQFSCVLPLYVLVYINFIVELEFCFLNAIFLQYNQVAYPDIKW